MPWLLALIMAVSMAVGGYTAEDLTATPQVNLRAPGRAEPVAAAEAQYITVAWDGKNLTHILIEEGGELTRVAYVVTYVAEEATVAYAANAYLDREGTLHLDARGAALRYFAPPEIRQFSWIPDSFAIRQPQVEILDDHDQGSQGVVQKRLSASAEPDIYREMRNWMLAQLGDFS